MQVGKNTLDAVGEPELVADGMTGDDFILDEEAEVAYVTIIARIRYSGFLCCQG